MQVAAVKHPSRCCQASKSLRRCQASEALRRFHLVKHPSRCCQASESLLSYQASESSLSIINITTPLSSIRVAAVKHPSLSRSTQISGQCQLSRKLKFWVCSNLLPGLPARRLLPASEPRIHWPGVQVAYQCGPGLPAQPAAAVPAGAIYPTSRGFQCHCRAGGTYSDPGRRRGVDGVVESRIPITRPDLAVCGRRSARACRVSERLVTSSGWYDSDRPLRRMITTGPP